jgi:hypothetical protein
MATTTRFEELDAWQTGRNLSNLVYDLADTASRQIHGLIRYLKSRPNASRVQEGQIRYEIDVDSSQP